MRHKHTRRIFVVLALSLSFSAGLIRGDENAIYKNSSIDRNFDLNAESNLKLKFTAKAPGTDWSKSQAESAVVSVFIDGSYSQDVVLWGGSQPTDYELYLGDLPAGHHTVRVDFDKKKSSASASHVQFERAALLPVTMQDSLEQAVYRYAPILIGRDGVDNNHTDTPLAMWYQTAQKGATTKITYGYVFSNEDGGTAAFPQVEQARWGRLTDIQRAFEVTLDSHGGLVREIFEGPNHVDHLFEGVHEGTHAVIANVATNNDFSDSGAGPLRFAMLPSYEVRNNEPLGELMRANPQWFVVQQKELQREGKLESESNQSPLTDTKMPDPRRFVYVQYYAVGSSGGSPTTARVTLRTGVVYYGDMGVEGVALANDGWNQTAVLLPVGTSGDQIVKIDFVSRGAGKARVTAVGHIFILTEDFKPVELKK